MWEEGGPGEDWGFRRCILSFSELRILRECGSALNVLNSMLLYTMVQLRRCILSFSEIFQGALADLLAPEGCGVLNRDRVTRDPLVKKGTCSG